MDESQAKRPVLVLEEHGAASSRWLEELERQFDVIRVVSVIGCQRAVQGGTVAAAVLNVNGPETRAASLIRVLRGQPGLELVPVIVLVQSAVAAVGQAVSGLNSVEVVDLARAHLVLRARVASLATAPKLAERRRSTDLRPISQRPVSAGPEDKHKRLQERFASHSAERSQRALSLCNELRAANGSPERRRAVLDDVKDLLNVMKGEATLLRLRGIAEILAAAESTLARIDDTRRSVNVPRGVIGLLSDLAALNTGRGSLDAFDVELHRTRLNELDGSTGKLPSPRG